MFHKIALMVMLYSLFFNLQMDAVTYADCHSSSRQDYKRCHKRICMPGLMGLPGIIGPAGPTGPTGPMGAMGATGAVIPSYANFTVLLASTNLIIPVGTPLPLAFHLPSASTADITVDAAGVMTFATAGIYNFMLGMSIQNFPAQPGTTFVLELQDVDSGTNLGPYAITIAAQNTFKQILNGQFLVSLAAGQRVAFYNVSNTAFIIPETEDGNPKAGVSVTIQRVDQL